MRGLTLYQPWAADVAEGRKRHETRGYPSSCQGVLAIHAGRERRYVPATVQWLFMRPDRRKGAVLVKERPAYSLGAVVAVCWLARSVRVESIRDTLDAVEIQAGDWSDGRWGWELQDVRALPAPVLVKGMQGLWRVDPEVAAQIEAQVGIPGPVH